MGREGLDGEGGGTGEAPLASAASGPFAEPPSPPSTSPLYYSHSQTTPHSHSAHPHSYPHSYPHSPSPPQSHSPAGPTRESQGSAPVAPSQDDSESLLHTKSSESILQRVERTLYNGATRYTLLQCLAVGLFFAAVAVGAILYSVTRTSPTPSPNQPSNQASNPAITVTNNPPSSPDSPTQPVGIGTAPSPRPPLPALPSNRPFKVLILADLHYGEAQDQWWGPAQDVNSTRVIESVLTAESPDFVVLLGDLVTGEDLVNATNATAYSDQLLSPIMTRGIPFASTYGNHDISDNLPREKLYSHEKQYSLSYTERSDALTVTGVTNYALQFRSNTDSSQGGARQPAPAFQFVFLDSNGITGLVNKTGVRDIDWVDESQVAVLKSALSTENSTVASYVFVHIPPPQFSTLFPSSSKCVGLSAESDIGVQREDRGLWETLLLSMNAVAVFSGHDHGSGWCCPSGREPPLTACFARHSGYGGYGSWPRGARVLLIDERDPHRLETWVRMEDATVVDRFVQESS